MKVWDIRGNKPEFIMERQMNLGLIQVGWSVDSNNFLLLSCILYPVSRFLYNYCILYSISFILYCTLSILSIKLNLVTDEFWSHLNLIVTSNFRLVSYFLSFF